MPKIDKVTICILAHNAEKTIEETIISCLNQDYPNLEIAIMENGSTDKTLEIAKKYRVSIHSSLKEFPRRMAENMERCAFLDTDIIVFMCDDDVFTSSKVVGNIAWAFSFFKYSKKIGHISRYYNQFMDGDYSPVRANRSRNVYHLADNISGLAFKREAIEGISIPDDPFIEAGSLVSSVLKNWEYVILPYDTVSVRIGEGNGSKTLQAYAKSPTKRWYDIVGNQDFLKDVAIGFIQIKNYGSYRVLVQEILFSVKINPSILLRVDFWFFVSLSLFVPRVILRRITDLYKSMIGRRIVRKIDESVLED